MRATHFNFDPSIDLAQWHPGWHNLPPRALGHAQLSAINRMLRISASWAGRRVTGFVAFLYLACVVMPSVALALAGGALSAYCFDEIAEQVAALQVQSHEHVHIHADGTVHHHVDKASSAVAQGEGEKDHGGAGSSQGHPQGHSHDGNCCGLFGFTAVLPAMSAPIAEPAAYDIEQPILTNFLAGRGPERINRPPILSLPM
jgi:hypothetical protein